MAYRGPQNGRRGLERDLPLGFGVLQSTFSKKVFWSERSFYEKSRQQEKNKRKEKIMSFLVATNVIASRLPERRLTGRLHARANYEIS